MRPKVGVDIDGCLYPFDCAARTILHLNGYTHVKQGDNISMYWDHLPEEAGKEAMHFLWNNARMQLFDAAPPYPGAVRALHWIEQYVADLIIVTHRPLDVAHVTMRWLARYKINPRALHHAAKIPKSEIYQDCICAVEDRPDNVDELLENTTAQIFVPRRTYNTGLEDSRVTYFDDWRDIPDWVTERT